MAGDELDVDALLDELEEAEEGGRASPSKESTMKSRITRIKETPKPSRTVATFSTYNYNEQLEASPSPTPPETAAEPAPERLTVESMPDRRPAHRKHLQAATTIPLATTTPSLARARLTPVGGAPDRLRNSPSHPKSWESEVSNPFKYPLGFGRVEEDKVKEAKQREAEPALRFLTVRRATAMHSRACSGIVPMRRWGHSAVVHRGAMYVFGGSIESSHGAPQDRSGETNDFHQLAFEFHEWTPVFVSKGTAPAARCGHSACVIGTKMVIFGGNGHRQKHYNDLHEFDFETQEWSEIAVASKKSAWPVGRTGHTAVVYGKRVFIFGGRSNKPPRRANSHEEEGRAARRRSVGAGEGEADGGSPGAGAGGPEEEDDDLGDLERGIHFLADLYSFDFKAAKWRLEKPRQDQGDFVPVGRSGHAAGVAGAKMYIMGGTDGTDYFGDVAEYCFESGAWSRVAMDVEVPRFRHSMHVLEASALQSTGDDPDRKASGFLLLVCGGLLEGSRRGVDSYLSVVDVRAVPAPGPSPQKAGRLVPIRCAGAVPKVTTTGHCSVLRSGSLYTFGGYSDNAAANEVHCAMLYDDVLVEPYSVAEGMAALYKNGADWFADVCFESPEEVFYVHKCVLLARAPRFWSAMQEFVTTEEPESQEEALRVEFVPVAFDEAFLERTSIPSAALLDVFLQYLYTCRLNLAKLTAMDLAALEDIAVRHNISHLAEHLSALRQAAAPTTVTPTKGKSAVRPQFGMRAPTSDPDALRRAAQKRSEEQLALDLKALLSPPRLHSSTPLNAADVKFKAEGRVVWAHRAILVALSKHFRRQFLGAAERLTAKQKRERRERRSQERKAAGALEQLQQQMQLQQRLGAVQEVALEKVTSAPVLHDVLLFLYGGEYQPRASRTWELMQAANALRLSALRSLCEATLYQSLRSGESNACDMLELAASFGAYQLKQQCLDMIAATYTPSLLSSDSYQRLSDPLKKEIDTLLVECGILPSTGVRKTTQKPQSVYDARGEKVFGEDSQVAVAVEGPAS
eukprot:EG_transcript_1554